MEAPRTSLLEGALCSQGGGLLVGVLEYSSPVEALRLSECSKPLWSAVVQGGGSCYLWRLYGLRTWLFFDDTSSCSTTIGHDAGAAGSSRSLGLGQFRERYLVDKHWRQGRAGQYRVTSSRPSSGGPITAMLVLPQGGEQGGQGTGPVRSMSDRAGGGLRCLVGTAGGAVEVLEEAGGRCRVMMRGPEGQPVTALHSLPPMAVQEQGQGQRQQQQAVVLVAAGWADGSLAVLSLTLLPPPQAASSSCCCCRVLWRRPGGEGGPVRHVLLLLPRPTTATTGGRGRGQQQQPKVLWLVSSQSNRPGCRLWGPLAWSPSDEEPSPPLLLPLQEWQDEASQGLPPVALLQPGGGCTIQGGAAGGGRAGLVVVERERVVFLVVQQEDGGGSSSLVPHGVARIMPPPLGGAGPLVRPFFTQATALPTTTRGQGTGLVSRASDAHAEALLGDSDGGLWYVSFRYKRNPGLALELVRSGVDPTALDQPLHPIITTSSSGGGGGVAPVTALACRFVTSTVSGKLLVGVGRQDGAVRVLALTNNTNNTGGGEAGPLIGELWVEGGRAGAGGAVRWVVLDGVKAVSAADDKAIKVWPLQPPPSSSSDTSPPVSSPLYTLLGGSTTLHAPPPAPLPAWVPVVVGLGVGGRHVLAGFSDGGKLRTYDFSPQPPSSSSSS